jgi:hypothetical protein
MVSEGLLCCVGLITIALVKFVVAKEDEDSVDLSWLPNELLPVQNTLLYE